MIEITKWEYKNSFRDDEEMKKLGEEGWEAVGLENRTVLYKRPCGVIRMQEVSKDKKPNVIEGNYPHY